MGLLDEYDEAAKYANKVETVSIRSHRPDRLMGSASAKRVADAQEVRRHGALL